MKKFKNTKLFKWLDKGTKAQAFSKKFFAYIALCATLYLAGYGCGTLMRIIGF